MQLAQLAALDPRSTVRHRQYRPDDIVGQCKACGLAPYAARYGAKGLSIP